MSKKTCADLYPRHIAAVARVHSDGIAFVDEERDLDLISGFERSVFGTGLRGSAGNSGIGFDDLQFDEVLRVAGESASFIESDIAFVAFFDEVQSVFDEFLSERDLLVGKGQGKRVGCRYALPKLSNFKIFQT